MTQHLHRIVSSYWPVITAIILFAAAWGTSTSQLAAVQAGQIASLQKQDKMSDQIATLQASIASVQAAQNLNAVTMTDFRERLRAVEARR